MRFWFVSAPSPADPKRKFSERFKRVDCRPQNAVRRTSGRIPLRHTLLYLGSLAFALCAVATIGVARGDGADPAIGIAHSSSLASQLGLQFVDGSQSKLIVERGGKKYEVDLETHEVHEYVEAVRVDAGPEESTSNPTSTTSPSGPDQGTKATSATNRRYYRPGDDFVFSVPTGRPVDRHTWVANFTHRFPYEAAFTGTARGATLLGLDDFAIPSFGLQYGVTSHLSVSAYRSPSIIGRPIELGARYNFLDERHGPFNAAVRFSVDGQDDFSRNFTTNFELQTSRSVGSRVQVYVVPTLSLNNRPVLAVTSSLTEPLPYQPCAQVLANGVPASFRVHPCEDTLSVGVGAAIDVRPTVALVGEVIPTAVNATELGIHRLPFSFGVQKKIFHHAFTFGFTTAPGTTTAQRIGTRSIYLLDPHADTPSGMFAGFDIVRQFP